MDLSKRWVPAPHSDGSAVRMEAPVDREVLAGLRGLQGEEETDIVAELASVFLDDARSGLEEVEEALQKGHAPAVERVAHKLKGGSGSMGAREMSCLCAQLGNAGASGDLSRGTGLLERIREELGRVDRALEAEVSGDRFQATGIRFYAESAVPLLNREVGSVNWERAMLWTNS